MPSIIFVCTGNQYRSPIAAAVFLKQLHRLNISTEWTIDSAGTWVTPQLPPYRKAIEIARDLGLDIENRKTCVVSEAELSKYDLVLVMEQGHKEAIISEFPSVRSRVHLISEVVDDLCHDIPDPADAAVDAIRTACLLMEMIERGFSKICRLAESLHKPEPGDID